ncbi:long-chain-fatty-acid--CoA ligase [Streptomyces cyaneofuscatus]|uniref:long-chain-fatty-acid--CoA ligase n=1 Tax=Streptomyces cyaneofuscatus TaxID=66883 RepID=UPI00364AC48E
MYLTQGLHRLVQRDPNRPFTEHAGRVLTYAQGIEKIARIAGGMRARGTEPGDRVAILATNSDRFLLVMFAVPWADAVLVPLNTRWSVKEIEYALHEADVAILFVDGAFAEMATELKEARQGLRNIVYIGEGKPPKDTERLDEFLDEPLPDAQRRGDALAGIFYTGGTTGFPKGVMLSQRNLAISSLGFSAASEINSPGVLLLSAPLFHLASLSAALHAIQIGSTCVTLSSFDPQTVLATIHNRGITDTVLVPTMIQMIVDAPGTDSYDLSSLRLLMYGGSPITGALITRTRIRLPQTRLVQGYGMTELGPHATLLQDADHDDPERRGSAGQCVSHALLRVIGRGGAAVPPGVVGEIVVSGDHVMLGYWKKPRETEKALRGGWMHTGDCGYLDEHGYLYVVDRLKDMIISGGENVYSAEVESAIALHPAVAHCAVVGVADTRWGERTHAVVKLAPGCELTLGQLRNHCAKLLARYKVPRSLDVVEEMPMSAAGKVLKAELRERYRQG